MVERVTDFSEIRLRFSDGELHRMPPRLQEMLRVYPSRTWREDGWIWVEVGASRWPEIEAALAE